MCEQALISIIVPIYKVERYLEKCVNSILAQTYSNLEIILVDDGSPDNCPQLCDQFAKKDSRIIVVHKENDGLSSARNAGIDIAKGEYIGFVDSDDWCEPDMFECLHDALAKSGCSIAICGVEHDDENGKALGSRCLNPGSLTLPQEQVLHYFFDGSSMPSWAWNKLYKRSLWENIRYPLGRNFEDIPVTRAFILQEPEVAFVPKVLYHYSTRSDSISGTTINSDFWYLMQEVEENVRLSRDVYGGRYDKEARSVLAGHCFHFMRKIIVGNNRAFFDKLPGLLKTLKENGEYIRYALNLKPWDKVFARILCKGVSPMIVFRIRKILVAVFK